MASCLVTGGAGFIGSHLALRLASKKHRVRVLDDLSSGKPENLAGARIDLVKGNICDRAVLRKAMDGAEFVFHEAAVVSVSESMRDPQRAWKVNVEGSRMVLEEAERAGARKALLASSAAVYGDSPPPLAETARTEPLSPYGESKLELERMAIGFNTRSLKTVSLRYFNVYGPRQSLASESGVIARFVDVLCKGEIPVIYGDGTQTRDFVYVADVVEANMLAMANPEADGESFNVATGKPTTLNTLASTLAGLLKSGTKPEHKDWRAGDIKHSYADVTKAERTLGFRPEWTLERGLKETIDWRMSLK
jgi:nucleoside-diphosphate-sugar epimerase